MLYASLINDRVSEGGSMGFGKIRAEAESRNRSVHVQPAELRGGPGNPYFNRSMPYSLPCYVARMDLNLRLPDDHLNTSIAATWTAGRSGEWVKVRLNAVSQLTIAIA